jgi:NTE family protein
VLPPVEWDGRLLIDGGVANNTPITHAVELGADEIYVLPTGMCALAQPPRGALGMVVQATSLMVSRRFTDETLLYGERASVTILPPPCPHGVQPMDFSHADELMTRAHADARDFLARRGRAVPSGATAVLPRARHDAGDGAMSLRRVAVGPRPAGGLRTRKRRLELL